MTTARRRIGWLACVSLAFVRPACAGASITLPLVQAHAACTSPNTELPDSALGGSACTPPVPLSPYRLLQPGKLTLSRSTSSLRISVSLPRVNDAAGLPIALFPIPVGFYIPARLVLRTTDASCDDGLGCTVVDRSIVLPLLCFRGKCTGKTGFLDIRSGAASPSIELGTIEIKDDLGNVLAVPGL
jgi:hypothetical protein